MQSLKLQIDNASPQNGKMIEHIIGLDFLRGAAIIAVIVYHWNSRWLPGGYLGVDIFFVVSGYIITSAINSDIQMFGKVRLKSFWFRRVVRLAPALVVLLMMVCSYTAVINARLLTDLSRHVASSFFYMNNWTQIWFNYSYFDKFDPAPLRHLWSLAIEGQFYVVWPLFLWLLTIAKLQRRGISIIIFSLLVISVTLMNLTVWPSMFNRPGLNFDESLNVFGNELSRLNVAFLSTPTRSIGLLFGAFFAIVRIDLRLLAGQRTSKRFINSSLIVAAGLLLLVPIFKSFIVNPSISDPTFGSHPELFVWSVVFVSLVSSVFVVGSEVTKHEDFWVKRPFKYITYLGSRSYGVYLFHWPVFEFCRFSELTFGSELATFSVLVVFTFFVAELCHRFVEQPSRNWSKQILLQGNTDVRYLIKSALNLKTGMFALGLFTLTLFLVFSPRNSDDVEISLDQAKGKIIDLTRSDSTYDGETPIAIGDSVMLGAARQLSELGFVVDAAINRDFSTGAAILSLLKQSDKLPNLIVVDLTNNTEVSLQSMIDFMQSFNEISQIAIVRGWVPLMPYHADNLKNLDDLSDLYPNLVVVDWMNIARHNKRLLLSDGLHLNPEGQAVYADLIMQAIGK